MPLFDFSLEKTFFFLNRVAFRRFALENALSIASLFDVSLMKTLFLNSVAFRRFALEKAFSQSRRFSTFRSRKHLFCDGRIGDCHFPVVYVLVRPLGLVVVIVEVDCGMEGRKHLKVSKCAGDRVKIPSKIPSRGSSVR